MNNEETKCVCVCGGCIFGIESTNSADDSKRVAADLSALYEFSADKTKASIFFSVGDAKKKRKTFQPVLRISLDKL